MQSTAKEKNDTKQQQQQQQHWQQHWQQRQGWQQRRHWQQRQGWQQGRQQPKENLFSSRFSFFRRKLFSVKKGFRAFSWNITTLAETFFIILHRRLRTIVSSGWNKSDWISLKSEMLKSEKTFGGRRSSRVVEGREKKWKLEDLRFAP